MDGTMFIKYDFVKSEKRETCFSNHFLLSPVTITSKRKERQRFKKIK